MSGLGWTENDITCFNVLCFHGETSKVLVAIYDGNIRVSKKVFMEDQA